MLENQTLAQKSLPFTEMNTPWVESPFFESLLQKHAKTPEEREMAQFYNKNGFLIVPNIVDETTCNKIKTEVDPLFYPKIPNEARHENRCQDAWIESKLVKDLACDEKILGILKFLYGREAIPFQTLNFKYGSQQRAHSDLIHFSSLPVRYMCGVWVALEDTTLENGPLFYYPGSHKLAEYNYYDLGMSVHDPDYNKYEDFIESLVETKGLEKKQLLVPRGTALIWSANLIHGGTPILTAGATRWSQVNHYYFENCIYTTPRYSNPVTGQLSMRTPINLRTGAKVNCRYNDFQVNVVARDKAIDGTAWISFSEMGKSSAAEAIDWQELITIKNSRSYRLGRLLTAPYRRIKDLLVKIQMIFSRL